MDKQNNLTTVSVKKGGIAFSALMVIFIAVTYVVVSIFKEADKNSFYYRFGCSFIAPLIILGIIVYYSKINGFNGFTGILKEANIQKTKPVYYVYAIAFAFAGFCAFGFINTLIKSALINKGFLPTPEPVIKNVWQYLGYVFALALLPAVTEEMLFRGFIQSSFSALKKVYVCLIVALIFALYHCSLAQFIYQFIFGVGLYVITQRAKSILPAVTAHFLNNFAVVSFMYFGVNVPLFSWYVILSGAVVLALLIAVLIYNLYKEGAFKGKKEEPQVPDYVKKNIKKPNKSFEALWFLLYAGLGIVLCLIVIITNTIGKVI